MDTKEKSNSLFAAYAKLAEKLRTGKMMELTLKEYAMVALVLIVTASLIVFPLTSVLEKRAVRQAEAEIAEMFGSSSYSTESYSTQETASNSDKAPVQKSGPTVRYDSASGFGYYRNEEGNGIIIAEYRGTNPAMVIPAEIDGYPVVEIAGGAFDIKGGSTVIELVSVIIPDNVTTIGWSAFRYQESLSSVSFPASLREIGRYAFSGNGYSSNALQEIDLSHTGLTSLGDEAFGYSRSLQTVKLPDTLETIEEGAFRGCGSLQMIKLPDALKTIWRHAFTYCTSLQTIKLPDTVETIGPSAFSDCIKLTSVNIPASIKVIREEAFENCYELTSLSIPDAITSVEYFPKKAFKGCSKLPKDTRKQLKRLGYKGGF